MIHVEYVFRKEKYIKSMIHNEIEPITYYLLLLLDGRSQFCDNSALTFR